MFKKVALPVALLAAVAFIQPTKAAALDRDDYRGGYNYGGRYENRDIYRDAHEAHEYRERIERQRREWRERELREQRERQRCHDDDGFGYNQYRR